MSAQNILFVERKEVIGMSIGRRFSDRTIRVPDASAHAGPARSSPGSLVIRRREGLLGFKVLGPLVMAMTSVVSQPAMACASCGCTLSQDWENLGSTHSGWKLDVRYDYLDQDQLRSGRRKISAGAASQIVTSDGNQEVEKDTRNQYFTLGLDYSGSPTWGVSLLVPYIVRDHSTLGTASDGYAPGPGGGQYDSSTSSVGDIKILGRYQGFTPQHNFGVQFGLKLPTGSHTRMGTSTDPTDPGPVAIDRGLQPGTGTTDGILGLYYFDALNTDWDYFVQATAQMALDSRDGYKPGNGYNLNLGVRYMGWTKAMPQFQINARHVLHDTGENADQLSTGGTLVYASPGIVVPVTRQASIYGFVQIPLFQDVRGVQLTPRYTASLGARYSF